MVCEIEKRLFLFATRLVMGEIVIWSSKVFRAPSKPQQIPTKMLATPNTQAMQRFITSSGKAESGL